MQNIVKRENLELIGLVLGSIVAFYIILFVLPTPKEKIYDCSISEISPDYPIEVKDACRKLRMEKKYT